MRKLVVTVLLALIVTACGGDTGSTPSAAPSTTAETESAPLRTTQPNAAEPSEDAATDTAAPSESTEASGPSFDGPTAPDFELALSDGSSFRLSDEEKPVYIVFWAEW